MTAALICAVLTASLAGCGSENGTSSIADESSISAAVPQESSTVSSDISAAESPSVSEEPISVSSLVSEDEGFGVSMDEDEEKNEDETNYMTVPVPDTPIQAFQDMFAENPIDAYYLNEVELAASASMLRDIIQLSTESWSNAVGTAYAQALESFTDSGAAASLQDEQGRWTQTLDADIQAIRHGSEDAMTKEYLILLHYRARCAQLLELVYENTGRFEQPTGEASAAG